MANIVGILIILIVIVGVRVGQSASKQAAQSEVAATASAPAPVVAPRPEIIVAQAPESLPTPKASPALQASIETARREIDLLRAERLSLQEKSTQLSAAQVTLTAHAENVVAEQVRLAESLAAADDQSVQLDSQLAELQSELHGIGLQISDVPAEKVTILRHRLNPIGREVHGKELHFRIADGRVARIPIEELVERLKPEIEREKDWIAKFRKHRGRVGPIDGFSMEYVVERQRLSVVDQLQQGTQMMRISVSGWKVTPESDLVAESVDVALAGDSKYRTALRLADAGTTITFWVYPDSFEAYRLLQEHAYATGFAVAARPLPAGVPIAGSPNGSRSSSQ
ncbi:MAG: hypothetical protein WBC44_09815 [Planctomycetaceae bacterium]